MTISTETVFRRVLGNGVTTAFSFPYHFFEAGDLLVYLEVVATGVATLQVLDTDYTVTGADDPSGGTVTLLVAPASTHTVVIVRKPDLTQTVNLSSFSASALNDALDRLYQHLQYFEWVKSRSIRLPDTMADGDLEVPFDRASKVLGFDSDGNLALHDAADYDAAAALVEQAITAAYQTLHSSQNPAVGYRFSSTTTDADPDDGFFRLNHATLASVTAAYLDNKDLNGTTVSGWLDTFDDAGKSANRGYLIIKGVVDPSAFFLAAVTGSVTDGTGYRKLSVTPISTGGTFQNGDAFSVLFVPRGVDGEVLGPASATLGNLAVFADTTGKLLADAGINVASLLTEAEAAAAYAVLGRQVIAGAGLTGGGTFAADRTLAVGAGTGITVNADDVALTTNALTLGIVAIIDGGGSTITTGNKRGIRIPFACTIIGWSIGLDQSGSIVVDIWKDTAGNYPPAVADTITASAKPTVTTATNANSTTLTGWTTSIAAGDWLFFNVDSVTSATYAAITLEVRKT